MSVAKNIKQLQNTEENLVRLAAQRVFYSKAKTYRGLSVFVATVLALAAPAVALWWPSGSPGLGLAGLLWAVIEMVILEGLEEHYRQQGALTLEDFDTRVLGLPWNDSVGARPVPEEVIEAGQPGSAEAKLKDWYTDVSVLPDGLAVLACQRSCLVWDKRSRRTYKGLLITVALVLSLGTICFAVYRDMRLADFLATLAVPILPAFQHAVKTFKAHRRAETEQERLLEELTTAWEAGLSHGGTVRVEQLRRVQDRLYQLRREQPPTPDWLYWLLRARRENTMSAATKQLIADANTKLHLP